MCGLLGHSFSANMAEALTLEQRLAMNVVLATNMDKRGGDSWGHADFYDYESWRPVIEKGLNNLTPHILGPFNRPAHARIGHTRKKTTGAISVRNAHPFSIDGRIIGAHNGIVSNHYEVARTLGVNVEVDSEVIFHAIHRGMDLAEIKAYGAITYVDLNVPGYIFLGRFNGGQLAVYGIGPNVDETQGLVWASTSEAVEGALEAAGLDGFEFKIDEGALYFAVGGRLFKSTQKLDFGSYSSSYSYGYHGGRKVGWDDGGGLDYDGRHRWATYWEKKNSDDDKKKVDDEPSGETVIDVEVDAVGEMEERTLVQLWKLVDSWSETELHLFFSRVSDPVCDGCRSDWEIYSASWETAYCVSCWNKAGVELESEDIITVGEAKRLLWSYRQQQKNAALTGGWSVC